MPSALWIATAVVFAGTPPTTPAPAPAHSREITVHPSQLQAARARIPAPLLYGVFTPKVGDWVDYDLVSNAKPKEKPTRVRVAIVGATKLEDGRTLYQVELVFRVHPRTLTVLWIAESPAGFDVERLAVAVAAQTPVAIPVGLPPHLPELRGEETSNTKMKIGHGPYSGRIGQRLSWKREDGEVVRAVRTDALPVFGVQWLDADGATWTAIAHGTGAKPELEGIPMEIPTLPSLDGLDALDAPGGTGEAQAGEGGARP